MAVVKQLWAQIGVNVTIQSMETNALFTKYMNGDYEASDPLPSITVRRARARRARARVARPERACRRASGRSTRARRRGSSRSPANSTTNEAKRKQVFGQIAAAHARRRTMGAAVLRARAHRPRVEGAELPHARERLVEPLGGLEELSRSRPHVAAARETCGTDDDGLPAAAGAARPARAARSSRSPRSSSSTWCRATRCGSRWARTRRRTPSQRVRHQLGLDRSLARPVRLVPRRARPRGDLGTSINLQRPVQRHHRPAHLAEHLPARLRHGHLAARRRAARRPLGALPQPPRRPRDPRRRDGRPRDAVVLVRAAARRGRSASTSSCCPSPGYGIGFFGHLEEPDAARDHASASTWRR